MAEYLATLNDAQRLAVTTHPHIPLQILAGPGSGKTHVLTCRIAHLVGNMGISPSRIVAVTFTNKAANEMRARLTTLIGPSDTAKLLMGTFHALCAKFLRQYGDSIGLNKNFTICDSEESNKIIKNLLKIHSNYLLSCDFDVQDRQIASLISKAKSKGLTPEQVKRVGFNDSLPAPAGEPPNPRFEASALLYSEYEATLRENKSLDFDDLLSHGVRLLDAVPQISGLCEHVFVDEFQDTNHQQYALMTRLASHHGCVSIVGDPDQSIYGWRAAEVTNLSKMQRDFANVAQVLLEQNYRSTQAILRTSVAIMAQDKKRIPKSLFSTNDSYTGQIPILRACADERVESDFVAGQVKALMAQSGGLLTFSDFAVLLRTSAHSRALESSLQREGVPHRVLKGHKFFERMEVKDLLSYLQLVDNPSFAPAFARAINTPPRGMGDKTMSELLKTAAKRKCSAVDVVDGIFSGRMPDIRPPCKNKLGSFVSTYKRLRKDAQLGTTPDNLLKTLVLLLDYEEHLKKSHTDWESRVENVQELINFAGQPRAADIDVNLPQLAEDNHSAARETPLGVFLQASMLSSDADGDAKSSEQKEEVVISTCHAAKGLEWPVVFVLGVEDGLFPHKRTEDTDEERRLLYVACTRAKAFLFLSHCTERAILGKCVVSPFVSSISNQTMVFSPNPPKIDWKDVEALATMLRRDLPDKSAWQTMNAAQLKKARLPSQSGSSREQDWEDADDEQTWGRITSETVTLESAIPFTGFSTAKAQVSLHGLGNRSYSIASRPAVQSTSYAYQAPQGSYTAENSQTVSSKSVTSASKSEKPLSTRLKGTSVKSAKTAPSAPKPAVPSSSTSTDRPDRLAVAPTDACLPDVLSYPSCTPSTAPGLPEAAVCPPPSVPVPGMGPSRKRLGMRHATGYINKKFKIQHPTA